MPPNVSAVASRFKEKASMTELISESQNSILQIPLCKTIDRNVRLKEMSGLAFVKQGIWRGKEVIVKVIRDEKQEDKVALLEFEMEVEVLIRMNHPNIVEILGAGVRPKPFMILEKLVDYSDSINFKGPKTSRKKVGYSKALQYAHDLAQALDYIHHDVSDTHRILHRDLKPDNLGITESGRIKLFDFGLSKCIPKAHGADDVFEMTGNTGSLRFMAPEVVLNEPYNEKCDVYSYSLILWTMIESTLPFEKVKDRAMHEKYVLRGRERPKINLFWPVELQSILRSCWEHDFRNRPQISDVVRDLGSVLSLGTDKMDKIQAGTCRCM